MQNLIAPFPFGSTAIFSLMLLFGISLFALEDMSVQGDGNPFERYDKKIARLKEDLADNKDNKDNKNKDAKAKLIKQIANCEKAKNELLKKLVDEKQRKIDAANGVIANADKFVEEAQKAKADTSRQEKEKATAKDIIKKCEEQISELNSQACGNSNANPGDSKKKL